MVRHVPYSGTRIVVYETMRSRTGAVRRRSERLFAPRCRYIFLALLTGPAGPQDASLGAKMALGATAGALGQLMAVPADVTKVRLSHQR